MTKQKQDTFVSELVAAWPMTKYQQNPASAADTKNTKVNSWYTNQVYPKLAKRRAKVS